MHPSKFKGGNQARGQIASVCCCVLRNLKLRTKKEKYTLQLNKIVQKKNELTNKKKLFKKTNKKEKAHDSCMSKIDMP